MTLYGIFWIFLSIVIALALAILPLPQWAVWFRPEWLLLVVIYWCIALPHRVGLSVAWLSGLALDGLSGSLTGEHALAMVIVAYVAIVIHRRMRTVSIWQQALTLCMLAVLFQCIIFIVQSIIYQPPRTVMFWLPAISSMFFWPWVFIILRDWRRRFRII